MGLSYNVYLNSDRIFGWCVYLSSIFIPRSSFPVPDSTVPLLTIYTPSNYPHTPTSSFSPLAQSRSSLPALKLTASFIGYQNFRGQHGKAYLFNAVVNIAQAEPVERNMTTGRHVVRDITCVQCKETVGWKYDKAFEASEKYKEGKYILEAELLCAVY
ncbi:hypothetical protein MMC20_005490 [Loxospora ochrophaea]|nr:hypothetical protein [Loxospora ochrophaea]